MVFSIMKNERQDGKVYGSLRDLLSGSLFSGAMGALLSFRNSASGSRSMAVLFGLSENKKYYSSACPVFAFLGRRTGAVLPEAESSADRLVTDDVVCLALAYAGFWAVYEIFTSLFGTTRESYGRRRSFSCNSIPLFHMICGLTAVSLAAFVLEAVKLGFVPLFLKGVPHAYSEFHLTGVHYITVSCVLVPSLAVLFFHTERGRGSERRLAITLILSGISLLIPILCVSRFQFVFAVILAALTYISLQKTFHPVYLLGLFAVMIPVYLILTVARSHDVAYLNGIFEIKNEKMPIFITQPYMYIANNYDNFNCLVEALPKHSFGLKSLFPLWALTGLKFFFPQLIQFPIYVNKKELTTLTMFYDAYYDFGWVGVLLLSCVLGAAAYFLMEKLREMKNPIGYLLYAQFAAYMILSFFTTWFSNTTTWFYLIVTGILALYYHFNQYRRR